MISTKYHPSFNFTALLLLSLLFSCPLETTAENEETKLPISADYGNNWSYAVDELSCKSVLAVVPRPILNMTIERIMSVLLHPNCTDTFHLKLPPLFSNQIQGQSMEVGAMPIDLLNLIGSQTSEIRCVGEALKRKQVDGSEKTEFKLSFVQELNNQKLRSKWRHYSQLQMGDIPLKAVLVNSVRKSSLGKLIERGSRFSSKCEKFQLEQGDFYLELLALKTRLEFEVKLKRADEKTYMATNKLGGSIRLNEFNIDSLFLDQNLSIKPSGQPSNQGARQITNSILVQQQPTVQIIHDHNNYYRKNNWLLNVYGNWLKHEYAQLIKIYLLKDNKQSIVEQVNESCLVDYEAPASAAQNNDSSTGQRQGTVLEQPIVPAPVPVVVVVADKPQGVAQVEPQKAQDEAQEEQDPQTIVRVEPVKQIEQVQKPPEPKTLKPLEPAQNSSEPAQKPQAPQVSLAPQKPLAPPQKPLEQVQEQTEQEAPAPAPASESAPEQASPEQAAEEAEAGPTEQETGEPEQPEPEGQPGEQQTEEQGQEEEEEEEPAQEQTSSQKTEQAQQAPAQQQPPQQQPLQKQPQVQLQPQQQQPPQQAQELPGEFEQ